MYVVIGVDPAATRLHAVIWDGTRYRLESRTMPMDMVRRTYAAYIWIQRLIRETRQRYLRPRIVVAIEEPVLGGRGRASANATLPGAKVHGALLVGAYLMRVAVLPVNNATWKKQIVGRGNASKLQIARHVRRTWPRLYREANGIQDWLDASCIALHGMQLARQRGAKVASARQNKE